MARTTKLLDPQEAARYGMITTWNRPTDKYNKDLDDKTLRVMAIPNYLGDICGEYDYETGRVRQPPPGRRTNPWRMKPVAAATRPDPPTAQMPPTPTPTAQSAWNDLFSPGTNIARGALNGATKEEFTGMRAEFTSAQWFNEPQGKAHRRLYSWYGYCGKNMEWENLMTLIRCVHFPKEEDML